ncbi:MAG: regulatory protein RecX [Saprospiraceae bacterium]
MENNFKKKRLTPQQALEKLRSYCAYQERCHTEVRTKILSLGVWGSDLEEIIATLVQEDFLNEERFAKLYAGSKFRVKHWGKIRIQQELKLRHISDYCLKKAMLEIDEVSYLAKIDWLLKKQWKEVADYSDFERKQRTVQHVIRKGYEPNLVWEMFEAIKADLE